MTQSNKNIRGYAFGIFSKTLAATFLLVFLNLSVITPYIELSYGMDSLTEQSEENENEENEIELELFSCNTEASSLVFLPTNKINRSVIKNCFENHSEVFTPPPELL